MTEITHEAMKALSKKATQARRAYELEPNTSTLTAFMNAENEFAWALAALYRTGQLIHAVPSGDEVQAVADAIERAECPGREGPFGGYDYGQNEAFYGKAPDGGRYVIRDFRDPASPDWGKWLHQTENRDEHDAMFEKMTREHIATAAITALDAHRGKSARKFNLGDRVTKTKGSSWTGLVVGFYSTSLTPIGYAVESENEPGSVQIYPESALEACLKARENSDG